MSNYTTSFEYCDSDALPAESTSASSLAPDQFYKLCPASRKHSNGTHLPLGQPRCGDGTNFSFLVARPAKPQKEEKILIELVGGGACWDLLTCSLQGFMLAFPTWFFDTLVGTNCSDSDDFLCSKTAGGIDFSTYTTVAIPYCTQDVHLGDEPQASYDGGANIIRHVGAHNMYRTLNWIFENFPNPSNVFLTGCSAGGTPLPVMYDMINSHYSSKDSIATTTTTTPVKIGLVADSPVFLTPSYFLRNGFPNWNAGTIMNMIGFDFDAYKNDEGFPGQVLNHALDRSKKSDMFGLATHDEDQTSTWYFQAMRGSLFGRDRTLRSGTDSNLEEILENSRSDFERRMATGDITTEWWAEMNNSLDYLKDEHENFDMFVMDGDGHCNFGLNVPLQYPGFEEWLTGTLNSPIESHEVDNTTISFDILKNTETNNVAAHHSSPISVITAAVVLSLQLLL